MLQIDEKHPAWVRWTHWVNFPLLAVMIWSGILIYWANPSEYPPFFPKSFYEALGLKQRLAEGMSYHFTLMWFFTVNGFLYVTYLVASGYWRALWPRLQDWKTVHQVVLHDLGLRKTSPAHGKFNAAQKITYCGVILMGALSVLTGIAIYKPVQASPLYLIWGSYETARLIHFYLTLGYVAFFILHLVQVARAGWGSFRSMVSGWEQKP